jgi:hypothetical protein
MDDNLNDDDFSIPPQNVPPAILRILIDVAAQQDAIFNLLVDYITKKGEIESEIMATYVNDFYAAKRDLQLTVYSEYGFDLTQLLRSEESGYTFPSESES